VQMEILNPQKRPNMMHFLQNLGETPLPDLYIIPAP